MLLILGFAFHWQATRAREADAIYDTVRSRIDTALNRGRCGLWDWDLARGRIFWSQSMFAILGLQPRDDLLTFGEVSQLVHPDDIELYELAAQLADATTSAIDHDFRMRHASGKWVWLRARCELVRQPGEAGVHLIGIARRHHRAEDAGRADRRRRHAAARRHRDHPGSLRAVGRREPPGAVQFEFPEAAQSARRRRSRAGTSYEAVVAAGRKHVDPLQARPARTRPSPARAPSRRSSTTAAGCRSASGAPRTAATSRSAPTSRR